MAVLRARVRVACYELRDRRSTAVDCRQSVRDGLRVVDILILCGFHDTHPQFRVKRDSRDHKCFDEQKDAYCTDPVFILVSRVVEPRQRSACTTKVCDGYLVRGNSVESHCVEERRGEREYTTTTNHPGECFLYRFCFIMDTETILCVYLGSAIAFVLFARDANLIEHKFTYL